MLTRKASLSTYFVITSKGYNNCWIFIGKDLQIRPLFTEIFQYLLAATEEKHY